MTRPQGVCAGLFVLLFAAVGGCSRPSTEPPALASARAVLSARAAAEETDVASDRAGLELRELCAAASERFWKRSGNEDLHERSKANVFTGPVVTYTSHFNRELHRCLVMVRDRALKPVRDELYNETESVFDASEGVLVAELSQTLTLDSPAPKITLRWGRVVPVAIQQRHWTIVRNGITASNGEWDSLNQLMEQ